MTEIFHAFDPNLTNNKNVGNVAQWQSFKCIWVKSPLQCSEFKIYSIHSHSIFHKMIQPHFWIVLSKEALVPCPISQFQTCDRCD